MKKESRRIPERRIVSLGPETMSGSVDQLADSAKLGMKRSTTITMSTMILAPAESCFEFISRQLEETPKWDPLIVWVQPLMKKHIRVGSMSRVNFSLDGVREESIAMIRSYKPNRSILWTSNHSSQLQEQWYLEQEPHGTLVTVTLGYNTSGWLFGRLADKIFMRSKVQKAVGEMLERLKVTVEAAQQS